MFLERRIQVVKPGCWAALEEINPKFDAVESKHGFPPKRRYRCYIGGHSINTLAIERDWESMAKMETAFMSVMVDPEWQALGSQLDTLVESDQGEVYMALG